MVALRDRLAGAGHRVLTFNYPYAERGSKSPDRAERLVECHRAAADLLRETVDVFFMAGRSMGGRIATYLAADGYPAAGVILYAYPLHPAGKEWVCSLVPKWSGGSEPPSRICMRVTLFPNEFDSGRVRV